MLEGQVRNLLKQYMQRGKVDVFITYEDYISSDYTLKYNKDLAAEYLRYLNQMAERRFVITPHMKEMSRLINKEIPQIAERRFSVVKEFTEQYQVVCALKDSRTVVMKEGHHPFLNLAGNSAMAKAGSGDVLAGMISGLAAQKTDIFDAVSAGGYFHACGGDEARKKKGRYSVLARDLIDGIGQCLKNAEERL